LDYFEARPILANKELVIFAGTMRWRAAQEIGLETVPVVVMDISDERQRELMVRDNVSSGEWDIGRLVNFEDTILLDAGFTKMELKNTFKLDDAKDDDFDEPLPEIPKSKKGEIYMLGQNRLMCGDSSKEEDITKLMDGKQADMMFSDPPYGINYGAKNRFLNSFQRAGRNLTDMANDVIGKDELYDLLVAAFTNAKNVMKDSASFYVTAPQGGELGMMMMMMMNAGLPARHVLNWVKNSPTFSLGRLDYDYQHEPILYGWKKNHTFYGNGKHKKSVWMIDKPRESKIHPTMKPVELVANAINNSTEEGQLIVDPFLGSGTSIIAAAETGRICYGMEIDPKYCDVIRKRWARYNGESEELT
jgi:DNA modification methylase